MSGEDEIGNAVQARVREVMADRQRQREQIAKATENMTFVATALKNFKDKIEAAMPASTRWLMAVGQMRLVGYREHGKAQRHLDSEVARVRRELGLPDHTFDGGYYNSPRCDYTSGGVAGWCGMVEGAHDDRAR